MPRIFKTTALIARHTTTDIAETLEAIIAHLEKKKVNVVLEKETATILPQSKLPQKSRDKLKGHCDLIIVVGGDGSMLEAAHAAAIQDLPVVGVNRGHLGFLTDIQPTKLNKLDKILAGHFVEEHRFLFSATLSMEDKVIAQNLALNDIVLLSSIAGHMIEFSVQIDDQFVCEYRADGLIIATPTGSTAYALAGGGPILHPGLDAAVLLPMFSHNLSSRPIVIKATSSIKILFSEKNNSELRISCDGSERVSLPPGGYVNICKAEKTFRLIHPLEYNYYETLRSKLHWERK
jgi:NAD+ kinase